MDYTTFLGIGSLALLLLWALLSGAHGEIGAFWHGPSVILVLGGALAATLSSFAWKQLRSMPRVMRQAFAEDVDPIRATVTEIVRLADVARRDGLLALDRHIQADDESFLARALRMVVDGYEPLAVVSVLSDELEATDARHGLRRQFLDLLGRYCPTFGMIGTLIGLVVMLRSMNDPSRIGPGVAMALLTTLYGLLLANVVFFPLSQKLANRNTAELLVKTIIIKGILAIQAGDNPRVVEQKLRAFLPAEDVPSAIVRPRSAVRAEPAKPKDGAIRLDKPIAA